MRDLRAQLPWTETPLIISAPMGNGIAGADLAIAVSRAGGLGQVGAPAQAAELAGQLARVEEALGRDGRGVLPAGVGVLCFAVAEPEAREATLSALAARPPAVVWLFGARDDPGDYAAWADAVRGRLPRATAVWVQVGSVTAALAVAAAVRPDALCVQGADAGGHGPDRGAGVVALLPETADALAAAGHGGIPLLAAGGIADGRGAAAALALGAGGVVLGTRFLAAREARAHPMYRAAVLAAADGGRSTARATVFDELRGPNRWPAGYDGRALRTASYGDYRAGVLTDEIRRRHAAAVRGPDAGYGSAADGPGRAAAWAGTAVGMVRKEQAAADIVAELRDGIARALDAARSRL